MRMKIVVALFGVACVWYLAAGAVDRSSARPQMPASTQISLWADQSGPADETASRSTEAGGRLTLFVPPVATVTRPAVIICPGGGYAFLSVSKEGTLVADRLIADGVVAFVLNYRLPKGRTPAKTELPDPEQDILRAVQVVRSRAAEWKIDPTRIGVMGFSAGGHVAAMGATMFDDARLLPGYPTDAVSRMAARPDFAVLIYPVISMEPTWAHAGSRAKLIGATASAAASARFSVDERVDSRTPPLFIAVARDDKTVQYHNAELMAAAADKAGVPEKLLVFDHGGHGFGLGDNAETKTWYPACLAWLKTEGYLSAAAAPPK